MAGHGQPRPDMAGHGQPWPDGLGVPQGPYRDTRRRRRPVLAGFVRYWPPKPVRMAPAGPGIPFSGRIRPN